MPSSNSVIGAVLRMNSFRMSPVSDVCTIAEYVREHPYGTKVLFTTGQVGHVVTAIGENVYDAWDSTNEYVQFVWYKEDY